mmetsp:Transcript_63348/g.76151  ORF Transcript_63348/g.76151 Transcript_63348/m.76151 type:complete len:283 (+) Transcript_63348:109-957(+)
MASQPHYIFTPKSTISQKLWISHNCHAPKRRRDVLVASKPKRKQKYRDDVEIPCVEKYTQTSHSLVNGDKNLSESELMVSTPRPLHDIDSTKIHFIDAGHFKTRKICTENQLFNELENQNPIEAGPYNQDAFKEIKMFSSQIPRDGECTIGMNVLQPSFQRMSTNKSILHYEKELISMNQNSSVDFKKDGILLGSNNYLKANNEDGERFPLHVRTQFSKLAVPTLTKHENSNKSIYERKRGNIRFKHSIRKVNIQPKANNSLTYPRCQKPRNFHLPLLPTLY